MDTEQTQTPVFQGSLGNAIARSSREVRDARATQIIESVRLAYRRRIEDKIMEIKSAENLRASHLDLSPDNSQCLISARNFNHEAFVAIRVGTALTVTKAQEELKVMLADYEELLGSTPNIDI